MPKKLFLIIIALSCFCLPYGNASNQIDSAELGYELGFKQGEIERKEGYEAMDPEGILDSPFFQGGYRILLDEYKLDDSLFRKSFKTGFRDGFEGLLKNGQALNSTKN